MRQAHAVHGRAETTKVIQRVHYNHHAKYGETAGVDEGIGAGALDDRRISILFVTKSNFYLVIRKIIFFYFYFSVSKTSIQSL